MASSLPPGIRRAVRSSTLSSADEPPPGLPQTVGGVQADQPPPTPGCAPGPSSPPKAKETARLRRIETYDSITTSIGEGGK